MKGTLNWGKFEEDMMLEKILLLCEFICTPLTLKL